MFGSLRILISICWTSDKDSDYSAVSSIFHLWILNQTTKVYATQSIKTGLMGFLTFHTMRDPFTSPHAYDSTRRRKLSTEVSQQTFSIEEATVTAFSFRI
ncbi:uncharacterized protein LOC118644945 isoform X2 [Monomorium pharaonis]|uniref:uncharacterized protein LOC118644945 isoform X2 n=1 Tax=Monomorium pharaonis TaxID=307658 RepID=UPI0017467F45|nr:uncharacterized protein LOC118644945 isoform X2 [Monomorium pharaonis]